MDEQKLSDFQMVLESIEETLMSMCTSDAIDYIISDMKSLKKYGFMEDYDD